MHFNKKEIMAELKGKKCRQFFGRKIEQISLNPEIQLV
jgi:hypothetical protein